MVFIVFSITCLILYFLLFSINNHLISSHDEKGDEVSSEEVGYKEFLA